MTKESVEELRERLLGNESVQQMIRARAYEIYRLRGGQPGREAHDWFQAQGEVLAFLIADEAQRADEKETQQPANSAVATASQGKITSAQRSGTRRAAQGKKAASKPAAAKQVTPKKPTGSNVKRSRKPAKPERTH